MSSSTTRVGSSVRGWLKRGRMVCGWRAIASMVRRRSIRPRPLRLVAAAAHRRQRQGQLLGDALGELEFRRRHRFEVGRLQPLPVGEGEGRLVVDLLVGAGLGLARRVGARRRQRLGDAVGARPFPVALALDLRQQQGHHLLEQLRVAPEGVERLVEDRLLLVPVEHHRRERRMDVVAVREADRLDRLERGDHPVRADRHARPAQDAGEVGDVLSEHRRGPSRAVRRAGASPRRSTSW